MRYMLLIGSDDKMPDKYTVSIGQGGLGLTQLFVQLFRPAAPPVVVNDAPIGQSPEPGAELRVAAITPEGFQ